MAKLLEMREVLHDESLPWAVTGAPRGPLEALPLALSCSEVPAMQGFGVEPKPRPNGQSVSALVMGIGVVRPASSTGRRGCTLPSFPSGRNEVHLKGLRRGVRPGRVYRCDVERYDFMWLLMSATEGNEEVKDGFLAVLVVLSEGKLNPAASPPLTVPLPRTLCLASG